MPSRSERARNLVAVGLLALLIAFVAAVQLRSQAATERTLEGQDNASLAFLIDDLHNSNDALAAEAVRLAGQRDELRSGGDPTAGQALAEEQRRLKVVLGQVPVHGPGVVLTIDAPLTAFDLQDAVNNLRLAGAEALAVNDHRVITGTAIRASDAGVSIDGAAVSGPWTLAAVGDPSRLAAVAQQMTRSLRTDQRVRAATYRSDPDLQIAATSAPRPFLYGSS